jgi:hypothetical protein
MYVSVRSYELFLDRSTSRDVDDESRDKRAQNDLEPGRVDECSKVMTYSLLIRNEAQPVLPQFRKAKSI